MTFVSQGFATLLPGRTPETPAVALALESWQCSKVMGFSQVRQGNDELHINNLINSWVDVTMNMTYNILSPPVTPLHVRGPHHPLTNCDPPVMSVSTETDAPEGQEGSTALMVRFPGTSGGGGAAGQQS